jgi:hypothetical protein
MSGWAMAAGAAMDLYGKIRQGRDAKRYAESQRKWDEEHLGGQRDALGGMFYGEDAWGDMNNPTPMFRGAPDAPLKPRGWKYEPPAGGEGSWGLRAGRHPDEIKNQQAWDQYDRDMAQYNIDLPKMSQDWHSAEQARKDRINQATGGPILQQMQGLAQRVGSGQKGILDQYDADTARLGAMDQEGLGKLSDFYRTTRSRVGSLAAGAEGIAAGYGRGAEELIDEQSARDLKGANDVSLARLAATGFGNSTASADQLSQNAANIGRDARQQKLGVRQATTDRVLGARSQRVGTEAGLASQEGNAYGGMLGDTMTRQYARAGDRTTQQYGNLDRHMSYLGQPINTQLGLQQGAIMNPWSQGAAAGYFPQSSGWGEGFQSLGNAAMGLGSYYLGQNNNGGGLGKRQSANQWNDEQEKMYLYGGN